MKKNAVSSFIQMIWEIVSEPSTDHIIAWSPNGTSFSILDPHLFADQILTTNFKHGNISSFVRQLNMYNFHKNKANTKQLEFYHKLFRRNGRDLLIGIKRKPSEADQREGEELLKKYLMEKEQTIQMNGHDSPLKMDNCEMSHEQNKEQFTMYSSPKPDVFYSPVSFSTYSKKRSALTPLNRHTSVYEALRQLTQSHKSQSKSSACQSKGGTAKKIANVDVSLMHRLFQLVDRKKSEDSIHREMDVLTSQMQSHDASVLLLKNH